MHRLGKVGSGDFPKVCQRVGGRAEMALGPLLPTLYYLLEPQFEGESGGGIQVTQPESGYDESPLPRYFTMF